MATCSAKGCLRSAVGTTGFCAHHQDGIRQCAYTRCSNRAERGDLYCPIHAGGASNRVDDDFVPARDEKVNDDPKVQRWLIDAKRKVERFDDGASDDWIGHFFGEQHLEVARKVLETMPTALQMWLDGEFKIVNRPLYERTNTLNAVRSADGLLSVSPGFLTGGVTTLPPAAAADTGAANLRNSRLTT